MRRKEHESKPRGGVGHMERWRGDGSLLETSVARSAKLCGFA